MKRGTLGIAWQFEGVILAVRQGFGIYIGSWRKRKATTMVVGHVVKPVGLLAAALISPGTLNSVALFTVVAAAELLLNDTIFACPCHSGLRVVYGLSFMIIPAIILVLADFPWKLVRSRPSCGIFWYIVRRPIGLAVIWIIIGTLERKYVDCIIGETKKNCEPTLASTWFQLTGLYLWLVIIALAVGLLLCRRRRASCIKGRSSAMEMRVRYEIEEEQERVELIKRFKYGTTRLVREEDLSLETLQALQPGLNSKTFSILKSEELLQPSVFRFLREDDANTLEISTAQRCLLRSLIQTVREQPDSLSHGRAHQPESLPASSHDSRHVYVNTMQNKIVFEAD